MRKKLLKKGFTGFALASALMISGMMVSASELPVEGTKEEQVVTDEEALVETEETVDAGLYDNTAPIVKSVTLQSTKVTYPEQIVISAEIMDDLAGVRNGTIQFKDLESGSLFAIPLDEHQGNIYIGKKDIDKSIPSGMYSFFGLIASDNVGNSCTLYRSGNSQNIGSEFVSLDDLMNLEIEIVNDIDIEEVQKYHPVVHSLEIIGDTSVKAPGVIELAAIVGAEYEIKSFSIVFRDSSGSNYNADFSKTYTDYKTGKKAEYPDGRWHAEIAINEHAFTSKYELFSILVTDEYGNTFFGSKQSMIPATIPEDCDFSFEVQGSDVDFGKYFTWFDQDSKITGEYTSDNYSIKSLSNYTKNNKFLLAGIVGKEQNIVFTDDRLLSNGNSIQLVFKGQEMSGVNRDIDFNVGKYVLSQSQTAQANAIREQVGATPAYVLDFSDKGDFPGNVIVRFRDITDYNYTSLRKYLGTEGLCLYEYKDGALSLVAENLSIAKDNFYEFTVDHGSTYVVTAGKVSKKAETVGEEFATYEGNEFTKDETGAVRCYDEETGEPVINDFKCDGTYTYYFQADGTAMQDRLTYHPDGVHVIYFDSNGHEVFSNFANVKKTIAGETVDDYCFFDVHGYLYVDVVTYDQAGKELYYANPYGVLERGKWFQFSESVKCADGNPWPGAAGNYGYANADGTLMVNQYTYDWEGRYCYLQGNGAAKYD